MADLAADDLLATRPGADAFPERARAAPLTLQIFADSSDANLAEAIALRLAADGHEIVGGALDPHTIDAVLVIWSEGALKSPAMLAAARAARTTTPIIPLSVDAVSAPPDFPEPAPMPLDGWGGEDDDPRWRFVVDELALVALRRGPPAFLRERARDDAQQADEDFSPQTLAAEPRSSKPKRVSPRSEIDGRTWLMAGAALALFAAFLLLPGRPRPEPTVAAKLPPATVARADDSATNVPAADAEIGRSEPAALRKVLGPPNFYLPPPKREAAHAPALASVAPASVAPALPGLLAPAPSLKPKRPRRIAEPQAPPTVKPSGVVDPLAALIVQTTDKSAAKAPKAFRDCSYCPPMLRVGPGKLASAQERQVAVARAFALGAHEVTFAEWDACVVDGGCRAYRPSDSGFGRGARPVINVSFEDATAYADWLSAKTGARYRLPTDEEWTYAAASGGAKPVGGGKAPVSAVGVPSDARGARGLLGNVWEWTADCTDWDPSGACTSRIVKGGAWNTGEWRKTPRHQLSKPEDARDFDLGFRVAREMQ
jgi:formylglycine-generating enzyme required for sulfatase activity